MYLITIYICIRLWGFGKYIHIITVCIYLLYAYIHIITVCIYFFFFRKWQDKSMDGRYWACRRLWGWDKSKKITTIYICVWKRYIYVYERGSYESSPPYIHPISTLYHRLQRYIYVYESICDIGWRRLIGSPRLQIIFHKRATKYRSLLRKVTYKDKGSHESSPPCICVLSLPATLRMGPFSCLV